MTMSDQSHSRVQDEIRTILLSLTDRERALLSAVVLIERNNLHIKQPNLKAELLDKVEKLTG